MKTTFAYIRWALVTGLIACSASLWGQAVPTMDQQSERVLLMDDADRLIDRLIFLADSVDGMQEFAALFSDPSIAAPYIAEVQKFKNPHNQEVANLDSAARADTAFYSASVVRVDWLQTTPSADGTDAVVAEVVLYIRSSRREECPSCIRRNAEGELKLILTISKSGREVKIIAMDAAKLAKSQEVLKDYDHSFATNPCLRYHVWHVLPYVGMHSTTVLNPWTKGGQYEWGANAGALPGKTVQQGDTLAGALQNRYMTAAYGVEFYAGNDWDNGWTFGGGLQVSSWKMTLADGTYQSYRDTTLNAAADVVTRTTGAGNIDQETIAKTRTTLITRGAALSEDLTVTNLGVPLLARYTFKPLARFAQDRDPSMADYNQRVSLGAFAYGGLMPTLSVGRKLTYSGTFDYLRRDSVDGIEMSDAGLPQSSQDVMHSLGISSANALTQPQAAINMSRFNLSAIAGVGLLYQLNPKRNCKDPLKQGPLKLKNVPYNTLDIWLRAFVAPGLLNVARVDDEAGYRISKTPVSENGTIPAPIHNSALLSVTSLRTFTWGIQAGVSYSFGPTKFKRK